MKPVQLRKELDSKQVAIKQLRNDKMLVERKLARREQNLMELKQALWKEKGKDWVRVLLKRYRMALGPPKRRPVRRTSRRRKATRRCR